MIFYFPIWGRTMAPLKKIAVLLLVISETEGHGNGKQTSCRLLVTGFDAKSVLAIVQHFRYMKFCSFARLAMLFSQFLTCSIKFLNEFNPIQRNCVNQLYTRMLSVLYTSYKTIKQETKPALSLSLKMAKTMRRKKRKKISVVTDNKHILGHE
jgi:hypothetical protein